MSSLTVSARLLQHGVLSRIYPTSVGEPVIHSRAVLATALVPLRMSVYSSKSIGPRGFQPRASPRSGEGSRLVRPKRPRHKSCDASSSP